MTTPPRIAAVTFALILATAFHSVSAAAPEALAAVKTQADVDALVASTADAAMKQALRDNAAAIVAAAETRPHVESIIHTIESARENSRRSTPHRTN